jgi:hypothetical protein
MVGWAFGRTKTHSPEMSFMVTSAGAAMVLVVDVSYMVVDEERAGWRGNWRSDWIV